MSTAPPRATCSGAWLAPWPGAARARAWPAAATSKTGRGARGRGARSWGARHAGRRASPGPAPGWAACWAACWAARARWRARTRREGLRRTRRGRGAALDGRPGGESYSRAAPRRCCSRMCRRTASSARTSRAERRRSASRRERRWRRASSRLSLAQPSHRAERAKHKGPACLGSSSYLQGSSYGQAAEAPSSTSDGVGSETEADFAGEALTEDSADELESSECSARSMEGEGE